MIAIVFLMPIAVGLAALFVVLFIGAAKNGQFEDLDDPATRILFDD